ncbi:MAG TPA: O-antigen ligase family protein, partial [Verrucomicrobiota bacterium]|nr:O-antigen ligase family protein [Verrucomicrobiota bacterium]
RSAADRWFARVLAALTVFILLFCLVSALNPRAQYFHNTRVLRNITCIPWLPHSYDAPATWLAFWQYLAMACVFWSVRDWLLGKTRREQLQEMSAFQPPLSTPDKTHSRASAVSSSVRSSWYLPDRMRRLLWVLSINGAVLALEGVLQRLDGSNKLLWLIQPRINRAVESQFGPYAYRSNASQYLNQVWPLCLALWFALRHQHKKEKRHSSRIGSGPHSVLMPCAIITAAAPLVSTSRGGAIIAITGWFAAMAVLLFAGPRGHRYYQLGLILVFLLAGGLGGYLGWDKLEPRLRAMLSGDTSNRDIVYRNARPMAEDHPWFGTGPGTFSTLYQYYRENPNQDWSVMAHDDWLETRITFGWVGLIGILACLLLVTSKWLWAGGIPAPWILPTLIWISLGGCLIHAKFDFPFQVLSILLLFVLICAILSCLARKE